MSDFYKGIQMVSGLLSKFNSIKKQANDIWILVEKAGNNEPIVARIYMQQYGPQITSLVEVYTESKKQFDSFTSTSLLDYVAPCQKPIGFFNE